MTRVATEFFMLSFLMLWFAGVYAHFYIERRRGLDYLLGIAHALLAGGLFAFALRKMLEVMK